MRELIISIMGRYGYLGVAALIAIENIFPPIPSEVILTFGGFMTTYTEMNVWVVILAATLGSMIGAIVLYGVGYLVSPEKMARVLAGRTGRVLRLKPDDVFSAQEWFNSKGNLAVFFCRFIPIIRSLISIPAGTAKMEMGRFLILTVIGSAMWNTMLIWIGVFAGASWERVVDRVGTYNQMGKIAIIILVVVVGIKIYMKKRNK